MIRSPAEHLELSQLKIRHIQRRDLPDLEWEGEYTHFRRLFREIYNNARLGKAILWGVEHSVAGLIGQVFVQLNSARNELANGIDRAYLYSFRVKKPYRNLGIGSHLLQTVEKDLMRRNYVWSTLNVGLENPRGLQFYLRHGYQKVAVEPGNWFYLDDKGETHEVHEPAWRMEKNLTGVNRILD